MYVRNDYDNCLTNLACSIRRHFDLPYGHATLGDVDSILMGANPKNVVVILCDGMGELLLEKVLPQSAFLLRNQLRGITTVFPATTVAATNSMLTGLNPCETGMLGWDMFYPGLGKVITVFRDSAPDDERGFPIPEAKDYRTRHMRRPLITDEINARGMCSGHFISPFGDEPYETLNEMFELIAKDCHSDGRKYIYAYYGEPDHTMHECGSSSPEATAIIRDLNDRIERLSRSVSDTVIIVTADHGHHDVENVPIGDYDDLYDCLRGIPFSEARAMFFRVNPGRDTEFETLFERHFGDDFMLIGKDEVIRSQLFGDGNENPIFRECLGDYLAIATGDKALVRPFDKRRKSHHAGYTDEEIFVPLIVHVTN